MALQELQFFMGRLAQDLVEPEPEPVAFDSVLRLDDQTFEIRDESP